MKDDICRLMHEFWENAKLAKGCNPSFVTLIPKVEAPRGLGDYRPISLIGCLYKIIAKTLAARIKEVIGPVIEENQFAFVGEGIC